VLITAGDEQQWGARVSAAPGHVHSAVSPVLPVADRQNIPVLADEP
jgi:hypothetical protein